MQKFRKDITLPGGRRMTIRADSQAELDKKIMEARIKVENGISVLNDRTRFSDYAEHWIDTYKRGTVVEKSVRMYETIVRKHLDPVLGAIRLADIRRSHCARILSAHAGESHSQVQKIHMTMMQIFESAVNDDILHKNPARGLKAPEAVAGTHRSITDAERAAILKVSEEHPAGLWIKIMLYCGLRPSEAADLRWSDVDFPHALLSVSHSIGRQTTKTRAGVRRVPIPDELLDDLRAAKRKNPLNPNFYNVRRCIPHDARPGAAYVEKLPPRAGYRDGRAAVPKSHHGLEARRRSIAILSAPHFCHRYASGWCPAQRREGTFGT